MKKYSFKENELITVEQLEEMEQDENVKEVECNGYSGMYNSHLWYSVIYIDGSEKNFYINNQN